MNQAFLYDAVRTPFGRFGGGLAGVRPDDLAAHVIGESVKRAPARRRAHRRGRVRQRQRRRRGQPQRRPDGHAAGRPAGLGPRHDGQPALRVLPGRGDHRLPADRHRRRRPGAGRRRRVDDAGAVGAAQDREALPGRRPDPGLHHAGLAAGQPGHARGVDGLAGRGQRTAGREIRDHPGGAGRVRRPLPQPRRRGLGRGLLRRPRRPGPGHGPGPRRGHPARVLRGEARRAQAVFRTGDGTVTAGNASPLSDGASAAWLGSENAAGLLGPGPAGPDRRPRRARQRPPVLRLRPRRGRQQGPRQGRHRLGRGRRRRAQRGLRRAVPGLHRRLGHRPGDREPPRRRDRDRPPARRLRRPDPGHPGPVPAGLRPPLGRRRDLHRRRPGPRRRPRERDRRAVGNQRQKRARTC